jgi:RecB family exonuclease
MKASHSEISTYLDCRVKHHFRYRQRLPIAGQSERLLQGIAVHAGLEIVAGSTGQLTATGFDSAIPVAQAAAVDAYRKEHMCPADQDLSAIGAATRAGVDFLRQADIRQVLAVEQPFTMDVDGWTVPGVIDLAYEDHQGQHHILDWKTSDNLPQDTTGTLDPQTAVYALEWMQRHGLTWMYAGRCYLRLATPEITITKGTKNVPSRISLQSTLSGPDYLAYAAEHPEHTGTADDHQKALAKFGPWWRHHEDMVTRDYCRAGLVQWRAVAAEIEQNLTPLPNFRPKMCLRCEYLGPCTDRALNAMNPL